VAVASAGALGVTDGVPGPGVWVGVRVAVGVPGTGVWVRVGRGLLVGALVGGMGVMVTIGVTGLRVGDGVVVGVDVRVGVGVVGKGGGGVYVQVLVGDGVIGVGVSGGGGAINSKLACAWVPSVEAAITRCMPGAASSWAVGVVKPNSKVPSPRTWVSPRETAVVSQ